MLLVTKQLPWKGNVSLFEPNICTQGQLAVEIKESRQFFLKVTSLPKLPSNQLAGKKGHKALAAVMQQHIHYSFHRTTEHPRLEETSK